MGLNDVDKLKEEMQSEKQQINIIVGLIFFVLAFVMVFITVISSLGNETANLFLFSIIIIINLLGYFLILLPDTNQRIRDFLGNYDPILEWLTIPVVLALSIICIDFIGTSKLSGNVYNPFVLMKYYLYVMVPITIIALTKVPSTKKFFEKPLVDLVSFLFILFWTWWGIEFTSDLNLFPDLMKGFGYFLNLLAISTLAWGFFIMKDYEIKRSFSRLFTTDNFKIILTWLAILLVLIVPAGMLTSFLAIDPGNLIDKGILGAIGYLILIVIGIFLVQGIGEELLFRGFFFYILKSKIEVFSDQKRGTIMVILFFFVSLLIISTPFVGLAHTISTGIVNSDTIPLDIIYPVIGIVYFFIGIIFMYKTKDFTLTMVLWSSMLFGWAHFEDWRYLIFATIAGIGYCETYRRTDNLFAASVIHMLVDAIWSAVLTI